MSTQSSLLPLSRFGRSREGVELFDLIAVEEDCLAHRPPVTPAARFEIPC